MGFSGGLILISFALEICSSRNFARKASDFLFANDYLISGDTLFAQGYGRYDLYGGDAAALISSLIIFLCAFVAFFKAYVQKSVRKSEEKAAARALSKKGGADK